jgi:hypothetical protein
MSILVLKNISMKKGLRQNKSIPNFCGKFDKDRPGIPGLSFPVLYRVVWDLKSRRIVWVVIILLSIAVTLFVPYKRALVFEYENTNKIVAFFPINKESIFQIKYTHSIHLSDVLESFKMTDTGNLQLYELEYEDFAVGMPANSENGEIFIEKNGKYHIQNMNRVFPMIDLRIGQVIANHTIIYQEKLYPLSKYIGPGTWVRIKTKQLSLFQQMKGVNILES